MAGRVDPGESLLSFARQHGAARGAWLGRTVLFAAAAGYFSLGWSLTMEWMDQGELLYPGWRVSEGAVPFRDFAHAYGPSVFFVLGALFRWFGADVFVVRMMLIVLKAAMAVIVYVCMRRCASRASALAGFAFTVAVLGTPWWIFNTPYPNHFGLTLNLVGFLAFLALQQRPFLASLVAGLCFGVAVTFKQTTGAFALVALLWFALYARRDAERPAVAPLGVPTALRLLALLGSIAMFAGYLAKDPHLWTDAVLFGPVLGVGFVLARREVRFPASADEHSDALRIATGAAIGFAIPLVLYAVYYAYLGALGAVAFSTVRVPAATQWFVPVAVPRARTAALVVGVSCAYAALVTAGGARRAGVARWVCRAVSFIALAAFAVMIARDAGFGAYLRTEAWVGDLFSAVFWLPFLVCWFEIARVAKDRRGHGCDGAPVLFAFYGVAALQHLYPAADFWHLVNTLPLYAILVARDLDVLRFSPPTGDRRLGLLRSAAFAALAILLVSPFAFALVQGRRDRPRIEVTMPRATGINDPNPKFRQAADLVTHLDGAARAGRPLLVVANEQMLYFLAGMRSAWDSRELLLYLVEAGLLRDDKARALVNEGQLLKDLAEQRPLIVDYSPGESSRRLWATFPSVGQYVAARYEPAATFGGYVVLDLKRETGGGSDG